LPSSKWFKIGYGIIIVMVIILLATKIDFIFTPIEIFFETLFMPFLISGVLYYLLRPIVYFLNRKNVPKAVSILLIYLIVIGGAAALVYFAGPELQRQFKDLMDNYPQYIEGLRNKADELQNSAWFSRFQENDYITLDYITEQVSSYFKSNFSDLSSRLTGVFSIVTSVVTVIVTVPFIVFYLLKDSEGASKGLVRYLPYFQAAETRKILKDMDEALSSYIQGQAIVSFIVGVMIYIGYLIIGIKYSLILAIVAMLTNVIPFLGPFLALVPAVIVGFTMSPFMALKVILVVIVVQQIDGNVSSPLIMGRKLDVHPLTIILILLVAGNLAGLIGMIVAVPAYAIIKVIISHAYRLYVLRRADREQIIQVED
jgi:predicted PurR-regulated permease PerM